ncbi:hypothetical protein BDW02DRAFT_643991 [Decorospora gaudefroyi]|uniref:Uncharacterized protein n=1 Tax=Decorospora gaudefroyi TaxID=184978 RepID=A0A6A5KSF9_9PLEO|nr:hypothetical protein BDW02DRAFT_643991 [Decorospora gaudefroyi]
MNTHKTSISSSSSSCTLSFSTQYSAVQLNPFWPELFSPDRQFTPITPAPQHQTSITQHHISNQMFPVPYASGYGAEADALVQEVGPAAVDKEADEGDAMVVVAEFFDMARYVSQSQPHVVDNEQRCTASSGMRHQIGGARLRPVDTSLSQAPGAGTDVEMEDVDEEPLNSVSGLQPFERLKQIDEHQASDRRAQQVARMKKWLAGLPARFPTDSHNSHV